MKILHSKNELTELLSAKAALVFDSNNWTEAASDDITVSTPVTMNIDSSTKGTVTAQSLHEIGAEYFVIRVSSQFHNENKEAIDSSLTLVGNAKTGQITALLAENYDDEEIKVMGLDEIKTNISKLGFDGFQAIQEEMFAAFSNKEMSVPDVLVMPLREQKYGPQTGDIYLKGAHPNGGDVFVFKAVTICGGNPARYNGLSVLQGLMVAFDATTGKATTVLEDDGYLTNLRTAMTGPVSLKHLGPKEIKQIGVIGTGQQARGQIEQLEHVTTCRELKLYGRNKKNTERFTQEIKSRDAGWDIEIVDDPAKVAKGSNLIITATPSQVPVLKAGDVEPGTLVVAIGTGRKGQNEIDVELLKQSEIFVDSKMADLAKGNTSNAFEGGSIIEKDLTEIGQVISGAVDLEDIGDKVRVFCGTGIGPQDMGATLATIPI